MNVNRQTEFIGGFVAAIFAPTIIFLAGATRPDYSQTAQTVSELVARGAPNRLALSALFAGYNGLLIGFGLALRDSAGDRKGAPGHYGVKSGDRVLMLGVLGLLLLLVPTDPKGAERTLTGVAHFMIAGMMAVAATQSALFCARWQRGPVSLKGLSKFSLAAAVAMAIFSVLTAFGLRLGILAGLMERLLIGSYEIWMAVTARGVYKALGRESCRGAIDKAGASRNAPAGESIIPDGESFYRGR